MDAVSRGDDQLIVPVSSFQLNIFLQDLQMILFCFDVVVNDFFETLIEPRFNTTLQYGPLPDLLYVDFSSEAKNIFAFFFFFLSSSGEAV